MPATLNSRDLLTPAQAADRIGWNPESVRRAAREGRIASRKIGGRVFIPVAAVQVETGALHRRAAEGDRDAQDLLDASSPSHPSGDRTQRGEGR